MGDGRREKRAVRWEEKMRVGEERKEIEDKHFQNCQPIGHTPNTVIGQIRGGVTEGGLNLSHFAQRANAFKGRLSKGLGTVVVMVTIINMWLRLGNDCGHALKTK